MANSGIKMDTSPECLRLLEAFKKEEFRALALKFDSKTKPTKVVVDKPPKQIGENGEEIEVEDWPDKRKWKLPKIPANSEVDGPSIVELIDFPDDESKFVLCYFRKVTKSSGNPTYSDDVVLIAWAPDTASVKQKMVASTTAPSLKIELTKLASVQHLVTINDRADLNPQNIYKLTRTTLSERVGAIASYDGVAFKEGKGK